MTSPRGLQVSGRPADLPELWARAAFVGFGRAFTEYLDEFYAIPAQSALDIPPPEGIQAEYRAFLAATVETLALDYRLRVPDWALTEILPEAICWEAFRKAIPEAALDEMKDAITQQTPTVFRQHGIHVRANVLRRV